MTSIASLPPELLLEIFGHLSTDDLLDNVQNVCITWRELTRHLSLWDDFVYSPQGRSFEEMVRFIEKCPMVKHIDAHGYSATNTAGPDELLCAIIENCSDLCTYRVQHDFDHSTLPRVNCLFEAFPNLESFMVRIDSENGNQIIDRISKCVNLKKLKIKSDEYCKGWLKPIIDGCLALESLDFGWQIIPEEELLYILENTKDRLLHAKFSDLQPATQRVVNVYGLFMKLKYLELNHLTEYGPVNFLPIANIKTLNCLKFCSDTSNKNEVKTMFDALFCDPLPLLRKLTIRIHCCDWGKAVIKDICCCYPKLEFLHLWHNDLDDTRDSFENICTLKHLETLEYNHSKSITDDDTIFIGRCPKLKVLELNFCTSSGLTDKTIANLTNCSTLESLSLTMCPITGKNLHLIAERLKKLKYLEMYNVTAVRKYVITLVEQIPGVLVHY